MGTVGLWVAFNACVLVMLALDLGVFNRKAHVISLRESALWSVVWVILSMAFNLWILRAHGPTPALEFFTGYLVEKSLSVDNVFVFLLVFRAFGIEPRFQHRVLFWGLLGALVLRGIMIAVGAALVQRFDWILYIFGGFLLIIGVRMLIREHEEFHPERNPILKWARRFFTVSTENTDQHFFTIENGRRAITPLFLALLVVEAADVIFAVDSIPAVFGITRDPFLVYTSNVCAILGMRAFYFLISGALPFFRYLDAGLSAVLIFIGGKMLTERWVHMPTYLSLVIVAALLGTAMLASLIAARRSRSREPKPTNA
jgi:tellurite resistance protein TerC